MSDAQIAMQWVQERLGLSHRYRSLGTTINAATPEYTTIDKLDGRYRVYYYPDKSYIMTYIDPKKKELWCN